MNVSHFFIGLLATTIFFLIFAIILQFKSQQPGFYRLFLIIFLPAWAGTLWLRPFQPSIQLVVFSIILYCSIIMAPFIPRRPPENRQETLELLEEIEKERRLEILFEKPFFKKGYWIVLYIVTAAVVFRYVEIYL